MFIQAFSCGPFYTNAYVVACARTNQAAIIDPSPDSAKNIQSFLLQHHLNAEKILLTHSHWDHIADVKPLKDQNKILLYIHPLDAPNLRNPGIDGLPCWLTIPPIEPDILIEEGMQISVGQLIFQILHTPGHSPGSVCFYESQQQVLFSGDTLFRGSIGNLSFPTSQPSLMWLSLTKLAQLSSHTRVFPGHGLETTIEAEYSLLIQAQKLFES